jgi:hypothetical protein
MPWRVKPSFIFRSRSRGADPQRAWIVASSLGAQLTLVGRVVGQRIRAVVSCVGCRGGFSFATVAVSLDRAQNRFAAPYRDLSERRQFVGREFSALDS